MHSFMVEDAIKHGMEKAIIIKHFRWSIERHLASGTHIHKHTDGKNYCWTYDSSAALGELFPYLNPKSIKRWLSELAEDGVLITGEFNKSPYDHTKWYSFPDCVTVKKPIAQNDPSTAQNEPSKATDEPSLHLYSLYNPSFSPTNVGPTNKGNKNTEYNLEERDTEYETEEELIPTKLLQRKKLIKAKGYDPADSKKALMWAENRLGKRFPNPLKQTRHIAAMLATGHDLKSIFKVWVELESDKFWGPRGFDFSTVANEIAKMRKKPQRPVNFMEAASEIEL